MLTKVNHSIEEDRRIYRDIITCVSAACNPNVTEMAKWHFMREARKLDLNTQTYYLYDDWDSQ